MKKVNKSSSFISNGIEIVKLVKVYDGDTAVFNTKNGQLSIRFLGINAPEATKRIEPFGKKATKFAEECLTTAKVIVIEADKDKAELDSTKSRYLAYIWYGDSLDELYLYQEDILRHGLAKTLIMDNVTLYNDILNDANEYARANKLGIYSKEDKDFCYETLSTSIKYIVTNINNILDGTTVRFSGVISGIVSKSLFIESKGYSLYVYNTYKNINKLSVGDRVQIEGQISNDSIYGLQITSPKSIKVLSHNNQVIVKEYKNCFNSDFGYVKRINNFKVLSTKKCPNSNSYYIYGLYKNNNIKIKFGSRTTPFIKKEHFVKNKCYSFNVGVIQGRDSYYTEPYPLLLILNNFED